MRRLALLIAIAAAVLTACDPGIGVRIENQTDQPLEVCFSSKPEPDLRGLCDSQPMSKTTTWSILCTQDETEWVVVLANDSRIYERLATCEDWEESGAWVRVEQTEGRFIVTDSLNSAP